MTPDELAESTSLISRMRQISKKDRKLISSSEYTAPADKAIKIRSWKMNEFKYYQVPSPFPTLARGVFTQWLPAREGQEEGAEGGHWRIVARGYDKFFNIGETGWTTWTSLETHTEAPYDLTLKSNGCIIFVAALTPDKLLVTSKHSLGPLGGHDVSHAQMGERWLDKHLATVGKTQADFAARLWKDNWTAVFELCDDSFEEHVLPIAKDKTGLHLHGINTSQPAFHTQPPAFLQQFAKEWGFIETAFITLDSVAEVRKFTEECSKTGSWNGEAIEGFVVRTRVKAGMSQNEEQGDARRSAPPYPAGSGLFFKVKFDEPYMMYRDFREITKTLISASAKGGIANAKVPQSKLRRPETKVYRAWVEGEIRRDRTQFEGYTNNHGIIATRDRFYEWLKTDAGQRALASEQGKKSGPTVKNTDAATKSSSDKPVEGQKWVIVPVAIPGCGKTAVAVALTHLFGFGHTQSDDVKAKKAAPVFLSNVAKLLDKHDVVIADKNNHLRQHRQGLRSAVANIRPPVKLLALNWATGNLPASTVHRICADRIGTRGANHQSLVPGETGRAHEDVLWRFLSDADPLEDDEVDASVEMDLSEGFEEALARAVQGIVDVLQLPMPSQEQIGEALGKARSYEAKNKAPEPKTNGKDRVKAPRYYAFLPEVDVAAAVEQRILKDDTPKELKDLWEAARASKTPLIVDRPHVTLVHEKALDVPEEKAFWDKCATLAPNATFKLVIDRLVYDGRVVAAVVKDVRPAEEDEKAGELVAAFPDAIRRRLHVTAARRDKNVPPVEAKALVEKWRKNQKEVKSLEFEEEIEAVARVKGLVA